MEKNVINWLISFAAVLLISCNAGKNSGNEETANSDSVNIKPATSAAIDTSIIGCYNWILKQDTAILQLEIKGANITGTLTYDFYEKDRNDGSLTAELQNGILTGWYLFRSEGVMSVRQVAWKVGGNALFPATGEMTERNDTLLFKQPDRLVFDSIHSFVKVPCIM